MSKFPILLLAVAAASAPLAFAQTAPPPPPAKKLFCWNENGQRVCSDALPAEAVNRAREEISARSGLRTGGVDRVMTDEERAIAASNEQQRQVDKAAEETRKRTDQAMLASYQSEADLRRVFAERTALVENSIQTSRYNVVSLREGLVSLLQTAGDQELEGANVAPKTAASIANRHRELVRQRVLQASFERQRVELDGEIADILRRYREMKSQLPGAPGAPASTDAPADATPAGNPQASIGKP